MQLHIDQVDAEVENRDIMRDAAAFGLHQGIEDDDTEMLKDAAAFRVVKGLKSMMRFRIKILSEMQLHFVFIKGLKSMMRLRIKILSEMQLHFVHQGIEVDSEMFKDAAAYRSSHNTAEVENRENIENEDDIKTVEETTTTEINKDNKEAPKEKDQKNNKKKKRRKKKKESPVECLVKAAKYGRFRSVAHWLEQGADANGRELRHGYTALHWASGKDTRKL